VGDSNPIANQEKTKKDASEVGAAIGRASPPVADPRQGEPCGGRAESTAGAHRPDPIRRRRGAGEEVRGPARNMGRQILPGKQRRGGRSRPLGRTGRTRSTSDEEPEKMGAALLVAWGGGSRRGSNGGEGGASLRTTTPG
jgi:hypothetical protein